MEKSLLKFILLVALLTSFATSFAQSNSNDAKKKETQQIVDDYYAKLGIVKQKCEEAKKYDYTKDKDKYCQFYQELKVAYDAWDKAYNKYNEKAKDDMYSQYFYEIEKEKKYNVEMQHYLENGEYYPILSAFKTNCTSLKEQMDELNTQTKLLDSYNKSIELKEIVLELGELKPYFAAKENMKNVGKNPASTPAEICASILNTKKEMDAVEPKFNKINTLYKEIGVYPRYEDIATNKDDIETTKKVMVMIKFREEVFLPNVEKMKTLIIKYGCK